MLHYTQRHITHIVTLHSAPHYTQCYITHVTTLHTSPHYTQCHITLSATLHTSPHYTQRHIIHNTTLHSVPHYTQCHITLSATLHSVPHYTHRHITHIATLHTMPHYTQCHITHIATLHTAPHYTQRYITHITTLHTSPHYTHHHITLSGSMDDTTDTVHDVKILRLQDFMFILEKLLMFQSTCSDPFITTLITYILYSYVFTNIVLCASLSGSIQWQRTSASEPKCCKFQITLFKCVHSCSLLLWMLAMKLSPYSHNCIAHHKTDLQMSILYVLAKLTGNSVHYQRYEVLLNIIEHLVHLKMCTQAEGNDWKASHLGCVRQDFRSKTG